MTIEHSGRRNTHVYQIDPDDPRNVQRKPNRPYARWTWYLRRDTPALAKAALLKIGSDGEAGE